MTKAEQFIRETDTHRPKEDMIVSWMQVRKKFEQDLANLMNELVDAGVDDIKFENEMIKQFGQLMDKFRKQIDKVKSHD